MKFSFFSVLVAILATQPMTAFGASRSRISGRIDNSRRVRLAGHLQQIATEENDVGAVDESRVLPALTMTLRPGPAQEADLEKLMAEQQDPASPNYHHWLTPEEYADRFGVSADDVEQLRSWLESQNLHVTSVARARNSIQFTGTAGDVNRAFQTELRRYQTSTGEHFANASEPSVPVAFDTVVRSIHGLNNFRMKPHAVKPRSSAPSLQAQYTSGSGNHYLSPADVATIYGLRQLHSAGYTGGGQSIVVAGQTRIDLTDLQQFRSRYGLPANDPQTILVPGTRDPGTISDDLAEADLDIELAGAAAPNAKIRYVYSYNVMDAVQYAVDQNLAPVISVSYGLCEALTSRSDALAMQTWARQGNVQGITWVNASGDSGGADCVTSSSTRGAGLAVDLPAGIPEVTGIGGTTLTEGTGTYWNAANDGSGGSALAYIPEVTWNDSAPGDPASGGGGASTFFSKPAWQTGSGVPADGARNVPDISFHSSAEHNGYLVYTSGKTEVFGGTSAATPVFAGMLALLNQYLVATGGQSSPGLGNVNPRLYALAQSDPSAFHDVQSGDNIVTITCTGRSRNCVAGSYGYNAGPGFDLATGLGSVDGWSLVNAWRRQGGAVSRGFATVTASTSSGTVTGTGQVAVNISISGTNGSVPSGTVTVSLGSTALGSAALAGNGSIAAATVNVSAGQLGVGANSLTIAYSGDSAYNPGSVSVNVTLLVTAGTPTISAIVNGASFTKSYAPGMTLSIFGSDLAVTTWAADRVPLSTQQAGTSVTIGGVAAPLYYVSPTQLNVQVPYEALSGTNALLVVNNNGRAASSMIAVASAAPGIFTDQSGFVVPANSVRRGDTLVIFITGQGTVRPAIGTGVAPSSDAPVSALPIPRQTARVTIGGVDASIQFIGIPPGLVGVTQINCTVPARIATGTQSVIVTIGGGASNTAKLVVN